MLFPCKNMYSFIYGQIFFTKNIKKCLFQVRIHKNCIKVAHIRKKGHLCGVQNKDSILDLSDIYVMIWL